MSKDGFIFATTGEVYTTLARRAARTLRLVMPDAQVDLFTDQDIDDPVFNQIHPTDPNYFRPKIDAMRDSRFERTVYLDADIFVCAPVYELFDILKRCDIAAVPGLLRRVGLRRSNPKIPSSFGEINSGVVSIRKNDTTKAFLNTWKRKMIETGRNNDQTDFRAQLFWNDDIRFFSMPYEYNFKRLGLLGSWQVGMGAPRIFHQSALHQKPPGDPMKPFVLSEVIGPRKAILAQWLLDAEEELGGDPDLPRPKLVSAKALLKGG